jgi:hypothetical protein
VQVRSPPNTLPWSSTEPPLWTQSKAEAGSPPSISPDVEYRNCVGRAAWNFTAKASAVPLFSIVTT